jgi:hypothetical protein
MKMREETKENIKWFLFDSVYIILEVLKRLAVLDIVAELIFWLFNLKLNLKIFIAISIVYFIYSIIYSIIFNIKG